MRKLRKQKRSGMLLLVVLALLAMFAMVAVAFVVLAGSEKVSATRDESIEYMRDPPQKTLEQAAKILANGSNIQSASVAVHANGLLEKELGATLYNGTIQSSDMQPVVGNQILTLNVPDPMHKVGCAMTMTTGVAAGLTTRIVGLAPNGSNAPTVAHVLAFPGGVVPKAGDSYIINGFPYSGLGFGFSAAGVITDTNTGLPLAYLPNNQANWNPAGGANCDYTAPDFQDMMLAYAQPAPNGTVQVVLPSFHRSELIAATNATGSLALLQQVMLRPIGANSGLSSGTPPDPNFTGSNPNFNPIWDGVTAGQGQWDVSNLGTGVPDSIWVDLGQPVRFTADGHAYKPLFAVLCLDMDGRLNLNAHGTAAQSVASYYSPIGVPYSGTNLPNDQSGSSYQGANFAGAGGSMILPRGQGTGPAEVDLAPLFCNAPLQNATPYTSAGSFNFTAYQYLMTGYTVNGQPVIGRYGESVGSVNSIGAGISGKYTPMNWNHWFPYGESYWSFWPAGNPGYVPDAYGSPPDTYGMGAVALDQAGRPMWFSDGGLTENSPYDIDLSHDAPHATLTAGSNATPDSPYSVSELERLLRPFDRDGAMMPTRLTSLTGTVIQQYHRAEVTTESYGVPVAASVLPAAQRPGIATTHPIDIIAAGIIADGGTPNASSVSTLAANLLPWETMEGLKMNVNRPFGAGARSSGGSMLNGSNKIEPDQPGLQGEGVAQYLNASSGTTNVPFAYDAYGSTTDSLTARQLYARHLYTLMRLACDFNALKSRLNDTSTNGELAARFIAQWAVNCVAYRDHNEIMIPFNYVVDPIASGWSPDNTVAHTVWGCKRPALLISETLAFHDRGTADMNTENVNPSKPGASPTRTQPGLTTDTDPKKHDPGFNSKFRPVGSLFIELFNPWPMIEPRTPDLAPANATPGVELTKITASVGGIPASPVWRMIIVNPSAGGNGPVNGQLPDPDSPTGGRPTAERVVYFVNTGGMTTPGDGQVSYYPSAANAHSVVITPGGYAVVGSGNTNQNNRTYIGQEAGPASSPTVTRMVTLNPTDLAAKPNVVQNTSDPLITGNPPQVLAIDAPQRMSISEPLIGYTPYEAYPTGPTGPAGQGAPDPVTGLYSTPLDIPVDQQREIMQPDPSPASGDQAGKIWTNYLSQNNTFSAYRIIYLQRLADPTRPWVADGSTPNPNQWNPYRTIDCMTVDLTTFNGAAPDAPIDPTITGAVHFESRQRGEKNYITNPPAGSPNPFEMNLWKQEPPIKGTPSLINGFPAVGWSGGGGAPSAADMFFPAPLNQSLGYLNKPYSTVVGGVQNGQPATTPAGDPPYPFPWFNWAYRPFVNEYELLQVPCTSSSQLLANNLQPRYDYGYMDVATRSAGATPFYNGGPGVPNFPHLLNFFDSNPPESAPATYISGASPQFHRVLAYLGVPTPFTHMSTQIRADLATGNNGAHMFHTPYNAVSSYREPGRLNLNTLSSPDVLMGVLNYHPASFLQPGALWSHFIASRRGDTLTNMSINAALPSRFMVPFRTPGGASLIPPAGSTVLPLHEVDVTIMRPDPLIPTRPLFQVDDQVMGTQPPTPGQTPDQMVAANGYPAAAVDYNRSSYFRYQMMQRLGSVASTHSNVFAIWITVGYFECTPCAVSATNPDGYQLGQELGSDTGDINRHRAFYIFDRSIPVGFIRGQDINSDKAFLLKRYIE